MQVVNSNFFVKVKKSQSLQLLEITAKRLAIVNLRLFLYNK